MRSLILLSVVASVAACGGSEEPPASTTTDSSVDASDTSTDSTPSDSTPMDSTPSDAPAETTPMGCSDAGALAAAASGKSVINGTLTPNAAFNGNKTAFAGAEPNSTATTGGGFTNFMSSNGAATAATRREFSLIFPKEALTACSTYTVVVTGAATGTNTVVINYVEGLSSSRWRCKGGTVVVDSVDGKTIGYHINATSCDPMASPPSNSAEGSFAMTGVGSSTTLP